MVIDILNEIYTALKNTITDAEVLKGQNEDASTFPCVTIREVINDCDTSTKDSGGEKYNIQALQIDIYANSSNKENEAKKIRNNVDNLLSNVYNMSRGQSGEVPNYLDRSIYRYTMTYSYKIDKNKMIYRS